MKLLLALYLLFPLNAFAILEFEDAAYPELVTSGRALAMGNAYMSKVDDSWSSFYNPAGLGTVRGLITQLGNVHLEANNGFFELTGGEGNFSNSAGNFSKVLTAEGMHELMADNPGTTSHARLQLFPNITYRGLTLGYMYSKQSRARLRTIDDDFELAERTDMGPVMSLSLSLFGGVIKLGGSAVVLTREQLQKDFASTDPVVITKATDYTKGTMTHITAGMRITLPIFLLPTLSGVIRNSSQAEFGNPDYSGVPPEIPSTVDASFSITPYLARTIRLHIEVGQKDMGNRYDAVPSSRKFVGGIEFDWMRMMFVRFGFADGWGSAGLGVRVRSFVFDLTTYAIEGSVDGYREEEDRRSVLSFSTGF